MSIHPTAQALTASNTLTRHRDILKPKVQDEADRKSSVAISPRSSNPFDQALLAVLTPDLRLEAANNAMAAAFKKCMDRMYVSLETVMANNADLKVSLIASKAEFEAFKAAHEAEKKAAQELIMREIKSINKKLAYLERALYAHTHPIPPLPFGNPNCESATHAPLPYTDVDPVAEAAKYPDTPIGRRQRLIEGRGSVLISHQHYQCQEATANAKK